MLPGLLSPHKSVRSRSEAALFNKLNAEIDHADAPVMAPSKTGRTTPQMGNPLFIAQFNLYAIPLFFTVAAGVYTNVTAAAVFAAQPTLGTQLPIFMFGNSDFSGGFKRLRSMLPLSGWSYGVLGPFIYGRDWPGTTFGILDTTARGFLQTGDLVIPCEAVLGGVNYVALTVIRCPQTGYGSLLDALNSNTFNMNMIRYTLADSTAASLNQYSNQLRPVNLSLFGKGADDQIDPSSYKVPEQQQQNIVDVPLSLFIDKQVAIASYLNYNLPSQVNFGFFVSEVTKIGR